MSAKYPDRLKALEAVFDAEAKRNNVYPIGLGMPKAGGNGEPSLNGGRKDFTYYPHGDPVMALNGPMLLGPHTITADITVPPSGAQGVIFAEGGRYGGIVLYVKDGKLTYENNFFGRTHEVIAASAPLTPGKHHVVYGFTREDPEILGRRHRTAVGRRRAGG